VSRLIAKPLYHKHQLKSKKKKTLVPMVAMVVAVEEEK
jgi:hypothetical protein